MTKKYKEVGSIGGLDVTIKIEVVDFGVHKYDDANNTPWYEIHTTLDVTMTFISDVVINRTSKLRQRLTPDEVEKFNEKGFIQIDLEKYKQQLKK